MNPSDYPDWLAQTPMHRVPRADGTLGEIRIQDGHLFVCQGCCCGNTGRGRAPVPLDEFKSQWKARRMRRRLHLTISGCLGPCTMANVVLLTFAGRSTWLHSIDSPAAVTLIYDHAEALLQAGRWLPPATELRSRHFQRYLIDSIGQEHCAVAPSRPDTGSCAATTMEPRRVGTHRVRRSEDRLLGDGTTHDAAYTPG